VNAYYVVDVGSVLVYVIASSVRSIVKCSYITSI